MKWEGEEESSNVEDRRGMGKKGLAIGGAGALIVVVIAGLLGIDPQKVNRFLGGGQGGGQQGGQEENRPLTAEEQRSHNFLVNDPAITEKVWDEQFRKIGKEYVKP